MVDFLRTARRKSLLSEIMYYTLNIGLVIVLFILSQTINSPVLAIVLVLLSKWRILAVRPRYWWTNIQANMVDIIVGLSFVTLMYFPEMPLIGQIILAIQYALWLLFLKPLSSRKYMLIQSMIAILFGVTALFAVSYEWPVALVVASMAVIGYNSARHFLFSYEEDQIVLLSAVWGLIFAEIGWLAHFWTFGYSLPGTDTFKIPQITIIAVLMSFLAERIYRSWSANKRIVVSEVAVPTVFVVALVLVILLFFNSVTI